MDNDVSGIVHDIPPIAVPSCFHHTFDVRTFTLRQNDSVVDGWDGK